MTMYQHRSPWRESELSIALISQGRFVENPGYRDFESLSLNENYLDLVQLRAKCGHAEGEPKRRLDLALAGR